MKNRDCKKWFKTAEIMSIAKINVQGVSQLTVIYNIQNTQIWVITEKKINISLPQEYNFSFEGESGHF